MPAHPLVAVVTALGLALTAVLTFAALAVAHGNNARLLDLQVREAAISLSLSQNQTELADALQVATATNSRLAFDHFDADRIAPGQFTVVSLWRRAGSRLELIAHVGSAAGLTANRYVTSFLAEVQPSPALQVTRVLPGTPRSIGFAEMSPGSGYIVFAEGVLPPLGYRFKIPKGSPFSDLNFALYLGDQVRPSQLLLATTATPIHGSTARASVPYGDTVMTLVGTTTAQLAGGFTASLPWIALLVGILLTLATASTLEYVLRRRDLAQTLAEDASALALENEHLYLQQRDIAGTLQRALLPQVPVLDSLEVAARYLPGATGVEVGGDWFDVIPVSSDHCIIVVGDVSGRGLRAATTMAAVRYATQAYVAEGYAPPVILSKLGSLLSFEEGNQFVTMLICDVDIPGRRVTVSSAAHLPPLLVSGGHASFLELPVGAPVGVESAPAPAPTTVRVPRGATLLAFTDGLVERRHESLDVGMGRLRDAAERQGGTVQQIVDGAVRELVADGAEDDVVVVGARWLR